MKKEEIKKLIKEVLTEGALSLDHGQEKAMRKMTDSLKEAAKLTDKFQSKALKGDIDIKMLSKIRKLAGDAVDGSNTFQAYI